MSLYPNGEAALQRFFEANPLYFLAVNGVPAQAGEAHKEIFGDPPAGWTFTTKFVFGYQSGDGQLVAMTTVVSDLLARGVWHVVTFILETARHGTGKAQALYGSLEEWAVRGGARWLRLGVVRGNTRAERFWATRGFFQVATGQGVVMGRNNNDIRVMVKPLHGQPVSEYYDLVERDRARVANAA